MTQSNSDTRYLAQLQTVLSLDRIDVYRRASDRDDLDVVARYQWNMALGEALYASLQALEVALRNTLYDEIARLHGPRWYDDFAIVVSPQARRETLDVKARIVRERKSVTPGRVVSGLTFGFWTNLLNVAYERHLWQQLWKSPTLLPYLARKHRTRKYLSKRMDRIRFLRNRVFHHEPIWHWHDLPLQHQGILNAIGWTSPVMAETVRAFDRFPAVHTHGPASFRAVLETLCRTNGYRF